MSARSSGIRVSRSTFFSCSVRLLLLSSQTMVVKVSCLILDTAQQSGFDSTYLSYGGAPTASDNAFQYAFFPGFGGGLFEPIYLSMSCVIYKALIYVREVVQYKNLLNSSESASFGGDRCGVERYPGNRIYFRKQGHVSKRSTSYSLPVSFCLFGPV